MIQIHSPLLTLPEGILEAIVERCDTPTCFALKRTSVLCSILVDRYMNEAVTAQRIFHHPEFYRDLFLSRQKESSIVAEIALSHMPELIDEPTTPLLIQTNVLMIKTAYVAALSLEKRALATRLQKTYRFLHPLANEIHRSPTPFPNPLFQPSLKSELWNIFSFVKEAVAQDRTALRYANKRVQEVLRIATGNTTWEWMLENAS